MREVAEIVFADVYPMYVQKVERKQRTKKELDEVILWLTGYDRTGLKDQVNRGTDFTTFFAEAPALNPKRSLITGIVCGVRVENIKDPVTQNVRYLDKLVDELAKGKAMDKVLRTAK